MTSLVHLSLTTGSARRSPRAEVSDEAIDQVRAALAEGGAIGNTGWAVRLIPTAPGTHVYDLLHDGRRVVTCLLCVDEGASDQLWAMAETIPGQPGTIRQRPASVPWLAVALIPDDAVMHDPVAFADVLQECGDLERVVAWTLME